MTPSVFVSSPVRMLASVLSLLARPRRLAGSSPRIAGETLGADAHLPDMANEDFLGCLSKARIVPVGASDAFRADLRGRQCHPLPGRITRRSRRSHCCSNHNKDLMEATLIAEALGLGPPDPYLRDHSDRAMAERIALTIFPVNAAERRSALSAMVKPMIERAIAVCVAARQAALLADEAGERLGAASDCRRLYWLAPLEAAHDAQAIEAARLRIAAHDAEAGGKQSAPIAGHPSPFAARPGGAFDIRGRGELLAIRRIRCVTGRGGRGGQPSLVAHWKLSS